jgi:hypothetical protein
MSVKTPKRKIVDLRERSDCVHGELNLWFVWGMFTRIEQPWLKRSSSHILPQQATVIAVCSVVDLHCTPGRSTVAPMSRASVHEPVVCAD